ncbi:hypothetical protein BC834DRAFT_921535 [Gloeopeniophorella convolvens]|nr:hypothetical protein BC834DRAFT_921535 [Gloeopeniophorella convolvens]
MSRRLYLGKLPPDTRSEEISKFFDGYGKIVDCRVMTGFGFVEFENARDAEDALQHFNGKNFMGQNIVVEFAKESRPRREPYEDKYGAPMRARRPPGIRIIVHGISRDTSWQDLKDFGREAGSVSFADIDRDTPGQGILEYLSREDAERAVKELDGKDLRGQAVRVELFDDVGVRISPPSYFSTSWQRNPDNYRRDERRDFRDDRYKEERYGGDRYRDDRHREDRHDRYREERSSYRRERSRSPPRRGEDDRRPRSPPPRREFDDKRPAGEDRRDKDDRFEDRASSRHNGDGGWR